MQEPQPTALGAWLRQLRKAHGLTLGETAERLAASPHKVTQAHLCRLELGSRKIGLETLEAISGELGAPRWEARARMMVEGLDEGEVLAIERWLAERRLGRRVTLTEAGVVLGRCVVVSFDSGLAGVSVDGKVIGGDMDERTLVIAFEVPPAEAEDTP